MTKQHVTIHDIARELGISASTVSRALRGHTRISENTRNAVRELAEKYNYQPNVVASSLRQGKRSTVGVVVPRINRSFFASVIGGMEEELAASGYHLIICQSHEKLDGEKEALKTLVNARVDAIFLSVSMETTEKEHLETLLDRGSSLFFFDRILPDLGMGSVSCNDRLAAQMSVSHMIAQGYRRIAHLAGPENISIYRDRKQGYLDAMREANLEVRKEWIMEKPLVAEGGEQAFLEGLRLRESPDAWFCAGDYAALGVLQAALENKIKVPEDLGVSGFANEPFTAYLKPSLTSIDQRGGGMGRELARMFLACEKEVEQETQCRQLVLEPLLVPRDSTNKNLK